MVRGEEVGAGGGEAGERRGGVGGDGGVGRGEEGGDAVVGGGGEGRGQREEVAEEGRDGVALQGGVRDAGAVYEAGEGRGAGRGGGHGDAVAGVEDGREIGRAHV